MSQGPVSVLIVHSDPEMRNYLCEQLSPMGYIPLCSDSIRCALKKVADFEIDVMICNDSLKDGNGIELIERMKALEIHIPTAILLSGRPALTEISALARGAELVFQKPFGLQDFIDGLRSLTGQCPLNEQTEWSLRDSIQNSPHTA